jgi:hypothetical protein
LTRLGILPVRPDPSTGPRCARTNAPRSRYTLGREGFEPSTLGLREPSCDLGLSRPLWGLQGNSRFERSRVSAHLGRLAGTSLTPSTVNSSRKSGCGRASGALRGSRSRCGGSARQPRCVALYAQRPSDRGLHLVRPRPRGRAAINPEPPRRAGGAPGSGSCVRWSLVVLVSRVLRFRFSRAERDQPLRSSPEPLRVAPPREDRGWRSAGQL